MAEFNSYFLITIELTNSISVLSKTLAGDICSVEGIFARWDLVKRFSCCYIKKVTYSQTLTQISIFAYIYILVYVLVYICTVYNIFYQHVLPPAASSSDQIWLFSHPHLVFHVT